MCAPGSSVSICKGRQFDPHPLGFALFARTDFDARKERIGLNNSSSLGTPGEVELSFIQQQQKTPFSEATCFCRFPKY
jgi:hypothetical protein